MVLIHGLIYSALLSTLVIVSLYYNPRVWIQDMPEEMQAAVPPLSQREKRERFLFAIPMLTFALIFPVYSAWQLGAAAGFWQLFGHIWIVIMTFNIVDLLLIDWLLVVKIQPRQWIPAGTEHLMHFNTYGYHLREFLKGTIMITVFSALIALVIWLVR